MTIKRTSSGLGLPGGFSFGLASEANGICVISGMPALDPDGKFVPGMFQEEIAVAWHNVVAIATAAGYSIDEIIYVQCVLGDIDSYGDLKQLVATAVPRHCYRASAVHVPGSRPSVRRKD